MAELELTRAPGDRRLYVLADVGTVRLDRWFSSGATAEAGGRTWRIARRGIWRGDTEVVDETGTRVGEFVPRGIRRGGSLRWGGRELALRPVSALRERYALAEDGRELVLLDGKGWGRRPVRITVADPHAVEPGLLLFAAVVVHRLASDASGATAGSTAAVTSSTSC